jgi:hypothetical protein
MQKQKPSCAALLVRLTPTLIPKGVSHESHLERTCPVIQITVVNSPSSKNPMDGGGKRRWMIRRHDM